MKKEPTKEELIKIIRKLKRELYLWRDHKFAHKRHPKGCPCDGCD